MRLVTIVVMTSVVIKAEEKVQCGKEHKIIQNSFFIFKKVFLMLLQDSPKQSDLAPGPELEPQRHLPAESDPGCCEYRACLHSCRRDIPLPVTQSPCLEVEHREAEAGTV